MNRDFKFNISAALVSGLLLCAGYMLQSAMFILPHFMLSIIPAPMYEKMRGFFWIASAPPILPYLFYIAGLAVFLDLAARVVNPTYRPGALLRIGNLLKYVIALAAAAAVLIALSLRMFPGTMAAAVFQFKEIISDYWGWVVGSSDAHAPFIITGVVFGVVAVMLFSREGFIGDMDDDRIFGIFWSALPVKILTGALSGAATGLVAYYCILSMATAHEILNRVVLWMVPPGIPLIGLIFIPAPLSATLFMHALFDGRRTMKSRAGVLAAAIVCLFAYMLLPRIENSFAAARHGYVGYEMAAHPKSLFKKLGGKPPENLIKNDTLIVFAQPLPRAFNRRNLWLDTGAGTAATLFSDANTAKAQAKTASAHPDAMYFDWADSYLIGKAGHGLDVDKELQLLFRSQQRRGDSFYQLHRRLMVAAATPVARETAGSLADIKQFHIGCDVWALSLVFRHQGRDEEAKALFRRAQDVCPGSRFGYAYTKYSPVFANGIVEGRIFIGGKPAAGARVALVTNDADDNFIMMKQNLTSVGRENLAAGATVAADGSFRFEGISDDFPYYLVIAAPPALAPPRVDADWARTGLLAQNPPGIISVSRKAPITKLGDINLYIINKRR